MPGPILLYITKRGDTLSSVAADFGHPGRFRELGLINHVPFTKSKNGGMVFALDPGTMLRLPDDWSSARTTITVWDIEMGTVMSVRPVARVPAPIAPAVASASA